LFVLLARAVFFAVSISFVFTMYVGYLFLFWVVALAQSIAWKGLIVS